MAEKKDGIDSFFDILDEGAKKLEGTLKHAHHPDKDWEDAEVIAFETQSLAERVRQIANRLSDISDEYGTHDIRVSSALNSAVSHCLKAALAMESRKTLKP